MKVFDGGRTAVAAITIDIGRGRNELRERRAARARFLKCPILGSRRGCGMLEAEGHSGWQARQGDPAIESRDFHRAHFTIQIGIQRRVIGMVVVDLRLIAAVQPTARHNGEGERKSDRHRHEVPGGALEHRAKSIQLQRAVWKPHLPTHNPAHTVPRDDGNDKAPLSKGLAPVIRCTYAAMLRAGSLIGLSPAVPTAFTLNQ